MRIAFATAAVLALLSVPPSALAQVIYAPYVTATDARVIAGQNGLVDLTRLRFDEGVWKLEGRDVTGRYFYMRIDPSTGDIVRYDRGWW